MTHNTPQTAPAAATDVAPGFVSLIVQGRPIDALTLAQDSQAASGDLLFAVTAHLIAAALAYTSQLDPDHDPAQFLNYLNALPVGLEAGE